MWELVTCWVRFLGQLCTCVSLCSFLFLPPGGVIAYISSSSSASSPASCHSESSDSGFQSSSSPVPSSPSSSSSESSCNSRSSESSDSSPKNDQLDDAIKTNQSKVAGLTKGHSSVTSMFSSNLHSTTCPISPPPCRQTDTVILCWLRLAAGFVWTKGNFCTF